jgi:hypothetical protein
MALDDILLKEIERVGGRTGTTNSGDGLKQLADLLGSALTAKGLEEPLALLTSQLDQLRVVTRGETESRAENTSALVQSTLAYATGNGTKDAVTGFVSQAIGSTGIGMSPLISGLARLFGSGGGTNDTPVFAPYTLPDPTRLDTGFSPTRGSRVYEVDYGASGQPRTGEEAKPVNPPQVSILVQALDSRSFLDRSDEIARAVREALLSSHSLNDVVADT